MCQDMSVGEVSPSFVAQAAFSDTAFTFVETLKRSEIFKDIPEDDQKKREGYIKLSLESSPAKPAEAYNINDLSLYVPRQAGSYQYYPLAISIDVPPINGSPSFQSLSYFKFQPVPSTTCKVNIRPLTRVVIQDGNRFELQEAYGLGAAQKKPEAGASTDAQGN